MGLNTTVVVLNDGLHAIQDHPQEFCDKLFNAIQNGEFPAWITCGHGRNVAQVVECHHADHSVTIKVGGNRGLIL